MAGEYWPPRDAFMRQADAGYCPFCGAGPFRSLPSHMRHHGVPIAVIREHYGLNRHHPFEDESMRKQRAAILRGELARNEAHRNNLAAAAADGADRARRLPRRLECIEWLKGRRLESQHCISPHGVAAKQRAVELHREGRSCLSIAKELDIPRRTIRRWLAATDSVTFGDC
jgi:hypothetical protein